MLQLLQSPRFIQFRSKITHFWDTGFQFRYNVKFQSFFKFIFENFKITRHNFCVHCYMEHSEKVWS